MKKIKLLAVALITAFAGMLTVNAETVQPELTVIGGKNVLVANGVAITVEKPTTEGKGATVKWDGGSVEVPADVSIFGGMHNSTEKVNTSITVNGGTVKNVFGGGLHISTVGTANIVVNGGKITSSIMGGGYEEFADCTLGDFNKVTEADVMDSTTKVETAKITVNGGNLDGAMIFGGGGAHAYTGSASITLNGYEGKISYLVAGGSNGYTGTAEITLNDGKVGVLQSVNRGSMDSAAITIEGGQVENVYLAGEVDPSVTGTIGEVTAEIIGGEVTNVEVGQNGLDNTGASVSAKDVVTLSYNKDVVKNIDETEFAEESVVKTLTLTLKYSADGVTEELSIQIPVGTKYTAEDVADIKEEIANELATEGINLDDFYADEELTKVFDMTQEFTEDTTVYLKFVQLREDDGTTNPETSDISVYGVIVAILLGTVGLGYAIKKRRFN